MALQRTAAPLGSRTVLIICSRLLQPTGRFRRRSLSYVVMPLFALPKSTRAQWAWVGLHLGMLAVALIVAWQKDGPPPEKAFWAIVSYFVEIAVGIFRWSGGEA